MNNSRLTLHGAGEDSHKLNRKTFKEIADVLLRSSKEANLYAIENKPISTGYTYFGQFLAHDISTLSLGSKNIELLPNKLKTATLRLNSLYGFGPRASAHLYQFYRPNSEYYKFSGVKFRIWNGKDTRGNPLLDCYRLEDGIPIMADARNDENFIVSQLHIAFLKYHNNVAECLSKENPGLQGKELFEATKKIVVHDYQQIILCDYLPLILDDKSLIKELIEPDAQFFFFDNCSGNKLLDEFIDIAFRLGHSQVRNRYRIANVDKLNNIALFDDVGLDLRGFHRNIFRNIEWDSLFQFRGKPTPQASKRIDHIIASDLMNLPFFAKGNNNLVIRNLQRGQAIDLSLLLYRSKISPLQIKEYKNMYKKIPDFRSYLIKKAIPPLQLPPWIYILLEAEIKNKGLKLGPLGSRIIAEQIIWTLKQDKNSIIYDPSFSANNTFSIANIFKPVSEIVV